MLERGLVSRILFPAPPSSYDVDCFPHDLIWVPKSRNDVERPEDPSECPAVEDCVPCLLLTYPSARFLIIFFHSNAEDLGRCHGFCCYIRDQFQVHVLAVEYPGYGVCPGVPCGETVMENALAAMRFVTDTLQWPMDSIKVFGRSIGTGPAIGLASMFSMAGLILVTPFLSVQELFRDRVGPFASMIEEWFPNSDSAPKITSPTMIIHGQRDELISCRHGESIYELLRPRKLLISPPEMEHNTNLLTNLQFFVLPMFQFFALPDYAFQDLMVPPWAYDKRRSVFYVRPSVEISSHHLPTASSKKKMMIPVGDDGNMPMNMDSPPKSPQAEAGLAAKLKKSSDKPVGNKPIVGEAGMASKLKTGSEKALKGDALNSVGKPQGRQLEPMFSAKDSKRKSDAPSAALQPSPLTGPLLVSSQPSTQPAKVVDDAKVAQEKPLFDLKGSRFAGGVSHGVSSPNPEPPRTDGCASSQAPILTTSANGVRSLNGVKSSQPGNPAGDSKDNAKFSSEARDVFQRLEDNEKICAREICSDELFVLEERMDADTEENMRRQEKDLADLVRARQAQQGGGSSDDRLPVAPRLLAAANRREGAGASPAACGPQTMWTSWCGKQPRAVDYVEAEVRPCRAAPAPGLPPSSDPGGNADLPSRGGGATSSLARQSAGEDDLASWEGWAAGSDPPDSPGLVPVLLPGSGASGRRSSEPSRRGRDSVIKNPLLAACCRALPSDPLLDRSSPLPRRGHSNEDDPVVPFGGRVIAGSHQPMSPEEDQLWRKYPLGTAAPPRRPPADVEKDAVPVPFLTSGFQRGTRFAI